VINAQSTRALRRDRFNPMRVHHPTGTR
jgi:hypothetical protein